MASFRRATARAAASRRSHEGRCARPLTARPNITRRRHHTTTPYDDAAFARSCCRQSLRLLLAHHGPRHVRHETEIEYRSRGSLMIFFYASDFRKKRTGWKDAERPGRAKTGCTHDSARSSLSSRITTALSHRRQQHMARHNIIILSSIVPIG